MQLPARRRWSTWRWAVRALCCASRHGWPRANEFAPLLVFGALPAAASVAPLTWSFHFLVVVTVNNIYSDGCRAVAAALSGCVSLRHLDLSGNGSVLRCDVVVRFTGRARVGRADVAGAPLSVNHYLATVCCLGRVGWPQKTASAKRGPVSC